ncbi:hypothetical protein [Streptomyces acidiscabies]|uniref:Uncharacterized protein n=1 Tax=Streptomyces acidiscabies TaxID=42234 RepID=A0A0L0K6E2_9ACTN|nr:hypothetical protein [Streptomyces acidiscabies]KND33667.1 hypothetical protein IQ63_18605 [Streptomyces acidiscabies]
MDETEFMRGRVYGADHEDAGPRHGRRYAELVGGPLDGLLLDVTERAAGVGEEVVLATEIGRYGAGGRSVYVGEGRRLEWRGDLPGVR